MRSLIVLIFAVNALFAASLLNQNIYEREKRVDLMLSFDTPFNGTIKKSGSGDGTLVIKLTGVQIVKPFKKVLKNPLVESISITGSGSGNTLIMVTPSKKPIEVEASKTIDGFGLRLRITAAKSTTQRLESAPKSVANTEKSTEKPLLLKESNSIPGWRYWSVLGIMLLLLFLLWYIKRKKFGTTASGNWLMPNLTGSGAPFEGAIIRYQKSLDRENRLVLLEFNSKQYLLVVGSSNLLLDTFSEVKVEDPESFTSLFESNKKQLDHFLKENHPDAYEAFKANATKD